MIVVGNAMEEMILRKWSTGNEYSAAKYYSWFLVCQLNIIVRYLP